MLYTKRCVLINACHKAEHANKQLEKKFKKVKLPKKPPKKLIGYMTPEFIQERSRCVALQA